MASPSPTPQPTEPATITSNPAQTPPNTQEATSTPSPSQTPTTQPLDITTHLTTWLTSSSPSIQKFWIGASWRLWARFDLYLHLLSTLPSPTYLLNHSLSDIYQSSPSEELDIHIEPSDSSLPQIGIILRCEKVNENCGSFETFREEMDGDIERVRKLGGVDGWFGGMRVFVVGVSGPFPEGAENEETEWRCTSEPVRVEIDGGEVNLWVYETSREGRTDGVERNGANGAEL